MKMTRIAAITTALAAAALAARAVTSEHSSTNGYAAITNSSAQGATWTPKHVFFVFDSPKTGNVAIIRAAKGITAPLGAFSFTNEASALWIAPTEFPIRPGDVLALTSSVPAFSAQIEKAE